MLSRGIPREQAASLKEEIQSLLEKGAISQCRENTGFFSTIFLVPKKNDQMRPVINLKRLNQWVESPHFKLEGIPTLRDLIRQGDWMVKVDLKDAYFTIPIHPRHSSMSPTTSEICSGESPVPIHLPPFRSLVCPMDIHQGDEAINVTAKIMGVRIIIYIDDMLILARTKEKAAQYLEALGFMINLEKSLVNPA